MENICYGDSTLIEFAALIGKVGEEEAERREPELFAHLNECNDCVWALTANPAVR